MAVGLKEKESESIDWKVEDAVDAAAMTAKLAEFAAEPGILNPYPYYVSRAARLPCWLSYSVHPVTSSYID